MLVIPLFYIADGRHVYIPLRKQLYDLEKKACYADKVNLDWFSDFEKYTDEVEHVDFFYAVLCGNHAFWQHHRLHCPNVEYKGCCSFRTRLFYDAICTHHYMVNTAINYAADSIPEGKDDRHVTVCFKMQSPNNSWMMCPLSAGTCGILYYNPEEMFLSFWYLEPDMKPFSKAYKGPHLSVVLRPRSRAGVIASTLTSARYPLPTHYDDATFDWSMLDGKTGDSVGFISDENALKLKRQLIHFFL